MKSIAKKKVDKILENLIAKDKIVCVDVGAKGGVLQLNGLDTYCLYYGFEPNLEEYNKLKQTDSHHYFPYGLSETGGKKQFYITKHASYSSLLECNFDSYRNHFGKVKGFLKWYQGMEVLKNTTIKTETLDSFALNQDLNQIDFLKLDTQGTELSLLKSGKQLLEAKKISVIFAEVTFIEVYKNQNLFSDLDKYLKAQGYEFIDCRFYPDSVITEPFSEAKYEKSRYSVGGDVIYVPRLETIAKNKLQCFKIGLILSSMRYLSMSSVYLKQSGLLKNDIDNIHRYMYKINSKALLKYFLPPILLNFINKIK
ncbi:FkbM family methyltransferase [Olleya sp. Bg11-27]|uniref:FkbM family methyltransferase n=1 Tax=Olleya sp. Bg11-27 TaxID=2058135 RepID=UPI0012FD0431|nr:FkbM family methyltransferase [Olleya sp. Bg11-27]